MKKSILGIAIVLFVALFTFVGCEKDKSAEVLSTYEEYLKSSGGANDFSYVSMDLFGLQGEDKKITKEEGIDEAKRLTDIIIKNTYKTLMTRGMKGCYIYCTNKSLQEYFINNLKK